MLSACLAIAAARRFARSTAAVSAIEFAMWAPILCLMMLGGIDITRYVIATGRIADVASTIGEMLSVNSSGTVNYVDLQFYNDSAMAIYPQVLKDAAMHNEPWTTDMPITMSSVTFSKTVATCTSSCTYIPKVVWSASSSGTRRPCTPALTSMTDTSTPSFTKLPTDLFGPVSALVVDVVFTFKPMFGSSFIGNILIARSFYTAPRYVTSVGYQTISGDNAIATVCP